MIGSPHPEPGRVLTEIRDAAVEYAEHGWPVQPGTYQVHGSRHCHGKPGSEGLEPIAEHWTRAGGTDPDEALHLWTVRPYSIIMACGPVTDIVEVPAYIGASLLEPLRDADCRPPTIVSPFATWLLLATPGVLAIPELDRQLGVGYRRAGTWIALPPTEHAGRCYRWRTHPSVVGWSVPSAGRVQDVLVDMVTPAYQRGSRTEQRYRSIPPAGDGESNR